MCPNHPDPPPKRFFGLNPLKLLTVLDAGDQSVPMIPGWTITGIAGRGGFGTVWRAIRSTDGAVAAIKIAPASEPDTLERIEDEIGALRALNHPHIVSLFDSGPLEDPQGGLFLAMEFIDGAELSQEIPSGGLPPETAYTLFRQISDAVTHAHEAGILHRDLKPANILLDPDGRAKVADFGLALPVHRRVQQLSLTRAGMIAGTAEYLPPEAYRQDYQPSPATDVFALGVILHEMLTDHPPRGAWPPVSSSRRVDVRMDELIRRALEPDPQRRWQSIREMRAAFEEITHSPPRYSGTPLVTFPIRFADLLWTLIGIYMLIASSSSLLHLRKSSFSLPFDLIGKHSDLIGGYHAVFILLQPAVALGIWQVLRLWRFRNVPMREALPSPFGLRLGHGRLAAALVCICQVFCLWIPALHILTIFFDTCSTWLRPGDPAWLRGLAVISWNDKSIVSPWAWHTPGDGFWLYDSYGPPGHPLARTVDRIGFTPLLFPIMMTLGGLSLLSAILSTLFVAARTWWRRDRRILPVLLAMAAIGSASVFAKPAAAFFNPKPSEILMRRDSNWVNGQMTAHLHRLAKFLLGAEPEPKPRGPISHWTGYYADPTEYRNHGPVSRSEIENLWQDSKSRAGRVEVHILHIDQRWSAEDDSFLIMARAIETCDGRQPDGASAAAECKLQLTGTITKQGITTIHGETFQRTPLYQTSARPVSADEAAAWARALKDAALLAASDPGSAARSLEALFHPLPFTADRKLGAWIHTVPAADSGLMARIRNELQTDAPEDVSILEQLPGGRTRVRLRLSHSPAEPPSWLTVDLIHHAGILKCIRLAT
jgi:serine/threonine protein kinase